MYLATFPSARIKGMNEGLIFTRRTEICWDCSDIDHIITANGNLKYLGVFTASKVAQNHKFPNRPPKYVSHASVCGCKSSWKYSCDKARLLFFY